MNEKLVRRCLFFVSSFIPSFGEEPGLDEQLLDTYLEDGLRDHAIDARF